MSKVITKQDVAAATRDQSTRRQEAEKAAAFLHERGATYVRGVFHKRSGWWSSEDVFLGKRSIEARAEFERLQEAGNDPGRLQDKLN